MTKIGNARDLGKPPGICNVCWSDQTHHPADEGRDAYHCRHNDVLAVPKADFTGWICESGVTQQQYAFRAEATVTTLELLAAEKNKMN